MGWFFGGFLIDCIALIIILCLSNLNEEEARFDAQDAQTRRLKEQLRQEQMKLEALRHHTAARLDRHDEELGISTRAAGPALPGSTQPRPRLPSLSGSSADPGAQSAPPAQEDSTEWYYIADDRQIGPIVTGELQRRVQNGYLSPETMVWNQNMSNWVALNAVPELQNRPG